MDLTNILTDVIRVLTFQPMPRTRHDLPSHDEGWLERHERAAGQSRETPLQKRR
jgi:hypothetical protein